MGSLTLSNIDPVAVLEHGDCSRVYYDYDDQTLGMKLVVNRSGFQSFDTYVPLGNPTPFFYLENTYKNFSIYESSKLYYTISLPEFSRLISVDRGGRRCFLVLSLIY